MSLLGLLILVCILIFIFGNPHVGPRVYPQYSYGYWPSGLSLVIIILLVLVLTGALRFR